MASAKVLTADMPPKSRALDELIMGTNSSSIVSKRSVEKLYHPNEPHYFRYFVKKFQRRAPLINRGYWLRLRAVDVVIGQFLFRNRNHKKIVVNLGCGSDVLPWQSHVRHASLCNDVLFVDIDYPDLMLKKRSIVLETPQLRDILGKDFVLSQSNEDHVLLRSERYCQVGCDLRDLPRLGDVLQTLSSSFSFCPVLFIAEVSITYMDTKFADDLIRWTSSIGRAEFCLLEQLLPHGPDHPFAATMLSHFEKLRTPPKSVSKYPTLAKQTSRFMDRGYSKVNTWDLWEAWSDEQFVSSSERKVLDDIEPFDEWEEFALFGRHYFILHASNSHQEEKTPPPPSYIESPEKGGVFHVSVVKHDVKQMSKRRFGDVLAVTNPTGAVYAVHLMGLGPTGREESCDIYSLDGQTDMPAVPMSGPLPRMCHTLTDLGDYGVLLVGGRTSPANALSDCWILNKGSSCHWVPASNIPIPLFRHAAIRLHGSSLALIMGGKTGPSTISKNCYVFHATKGWLQCEVIGEAPVLLFGAVLCNAPGRLKSDGTFAGLLAGGIGLDGLINSKKYTWHLDIKNSQPTIQFTEFREQPLDQLRDLAVFGARIVDLKSQTLVCGGVGSSSRSLGQSIIAVHMTDTGPYATSKVETCPSGKSLPFMVGSAILQAEDGIVVFGGGATCFSMGTYWETGVFRLTLSRGCETLGQHLPRVQLLGSQRVVSSTRHRLRQDSNSAKATMTRISRVRLQTTAQFEDILRTGLPVVISDANFGDCVQKWTPPYLIDRIGYDTKVVAHECKHDHERMDFNSKNFRYVTESFGKVMTRAEAGERIYLRALSRKQPSERPANIRDDFPNLAEDFILPKEMDRANRGLFSSVLRISGRTNMWLHYDVMANVYAQISGSKRMILFPPRDVEHLLFAPGASSSSLDVFSELETPRMGATHPYEALLTPGDILFLPPCWPHTAATTTSWSVAVNVFFRDLESGYATGRDVYGNRDLAAYEKGRLEVNRVGKSFQHLPPETRRFYLKRLADELELTAEG
ncbi:Leucine carboxyl methyltransferase family [Metarhizium rileyi]|uniref:tRNA wybutosine-synthesizing protein 4 n=1 Tax=Metarhizium rileyi (strain RCEF 4871) TaxID=1649241 RepID=A0A167ET49_METRR|nr:Leucine carboxyl methyltransferase family [Metarhizium rileyi RCEF 4871]